MNSTAPIAEDYDFFLMANVHPRDSGLPLIVYISESQGQYDVRVLVRSLDSSEFIAAASVRAEIKIVEGALPANEFELLRQWIELNRDVIVGYWDRTIEATSDALAALKPLPKN